MRRPLVHLIMIFYIIFEKETAHKKTDHPTENLNGFSSFMTHFQKMVNVFQSSRFVLDSVVSIDSIFQEFDSRLRILFFTTHDDLIQNTSLQK